MSRHVIMYGGIAALVVLGYVGILFQENIWQPSTLPAFQISQINEPSEQLTRKNLQGRWVLINFWASWCDICSGEIPILNSVNERIPVIGVIANDAKERVLQSDKLVARVYENYFDANSLFFQELKLEGLPTTLLVNPKGEIVFKMEGALNTKILAQMERLTGKNL